MTILSESFNAAVTICSKVAVTFMEARSCFLAYVGLHGSIQCIICNVCLNVEYDL